MFDCCTGHPLTAKALVSQDPQTYSSYTEGKWILCEPDAEMVPRCAEKGPGSVADCPPTTIPQILKTIAAGSKASKEMLKVERPVPPLNADGSVPPPLPRDQWTTWTYQQVYEDSRKVAKAFILLGVPAFGSVNVWGFNSPEWMLSFYGATMVGAKIAGLYPTDTDETAAYKVIHAGGAVVVVEDRAKMDRLVKAMNERGDAQRLKAIVAYGFEPAVGETVHIKGCGTIPLTSWKKLLESGAAAPGGDAQVDARMAAVKPGHCAALIYTSGTTGEPKAAMMTHDTLWWEANTIVHTLQPDGLFAKAEEERIISYLPLSHIGGMQLDMMSPLAGTYLSDAWESVWFARPYDLKAGSIGQRLGAIRPTFMFGVPLVWEKIADKVRAIGAANTGAKKMLGDWAKGLAFERNKNKQLGGSGATPAGYTLASGAVLSKVKVALGLDQCKWAGTGAAPIRVDTLEYFASLNLPIYELYGMSECSGVCSMSNLSVFQWGTCGPPIPACELKVFRVDDVDINKKTPVPKAPDLDSTDEHYQGELCYRGRNIMMGYLAQADLGKDHVKDIEKKTADAIDSEGWLHSGDKGIITMQNMVKITGRYKELIIGEGGENIAPVPIEDHVKKECDGIAEVMMIGDKRKYNVALITLKAKGANGEVPGSDDLDAAAERLNPNVKTISAAMDDSTWIKAITAAVEAANKNGKVCPNNAFKIQKFTILPTNFSEQGSELTPTKKLKRKVVETKYSKIIDKLYAAQGVYVKFEA